MKKLLEEYEKVKNLHDDTEMLIEFVEMGDISFNEELEEKICIAE